mgnify:CR=1 FL=1
MKKNILSALALCAVVGLSSCDSFLELEPLDKVSGDKLTETDGVMPQSLWKILYSVPTQVSMPVTMTV